MNDLIEHCAMLCVDSYDDDAKGFVTVGDLRYGVFQTEHGKIICIRGTANLENAVTDVRVLPVRSCGNFLAHKGFVTAYRELCSAGMPTCKNEQMIATGHSMGGALATLLAEHTGCRLITFGSPKVYWRFGKAPVLKHIRVIRDDDPVPMVPKFLYSHRCDALELNDRDSGWLPQVKDHSMSGYLKNIRLRQFLD